VLDALSKVMSIALGLPARTMENELAKGVDAFGVLIAVTAVVVPVNAQLIFLSTKFPSSCVYVFLFTLSVLSMI
jgi:hypothetical protein